MYQRSIFIFIKTMCLIIFHSHQVIKVVINFSVIYLFFMYVYITNWSYLLNYFVIYLLRTFFYSILECYKFKDGKGRTVKTLWASRMWRPTGRYSCPHPSWQWILSVRCSDYNMKKTRHNLHHVINFLKNVDDQIRIKASWAYSHKSL